MKVVRLFTGEDGRSHFEDLDIEMTSETLGGRLSDLWPGRGVQFREVDADYSLELHNAPRRQLVVNLTGSVEIETGDGTTRVLGPGSILLAEDTDGEGHFSRHVDDEPRTCLFIHLDEPED